jgi:hypothetical protein
MRGKMMKTTILKILRFIGLSIIALVVWCFVIITGLLLGA